MIIQVCNRPISAPGAWVRRSLQTSTPMPPPPQKGGKFLDTLNPPKLYPCRQEKHIVFAHYSVFVVRDWIPAIKILEHRRKPAFPPGTIITKMARGWESKSVEAQQSEASEKRAESRPRLTAEAASRVRELETLRLSRQRVLQQLERTVNPRHRLLLESELADLDQKLASKRSR